MHSTFDNIFTLICTNDKLRYCVLVIGCSDLTPPAHAWYKREGSEAVIGCKSNDRVWRLYCNGNTWDGVVGNCSAAEGKIELDIVNIHVFIMC